MHMLTYNGNERIWYKIWSMQQSISLETAFPKYIDKRQLYYTVWVQMSVITAVIKFNQRSACVFV